MAQNPLAHGIRAVTVKQLRDYLNTTPPPPSKLGYVYLVGMLGPSPNSTSTCLHFTFQDGTSDRMDMVQAFMVSERFKDLDERVNREMNESLDKEEVSKAIPFPYQENVYYKVLGLMNRENGHVEVRTVTRITDFNEITYHSCLVIHTHLKLQNK